MEFKKLEELDYESEPKFSEWLVIYEPYFTDYNDVAYWEPLNFLHILSELGGESDTVKTFFGYHIVSEWERKTNTPNSLILVHPGDTERIAIAQKLNDSLKNYPLLNEEDTCDYEGELIWQAWNSYLKDDIYSELSKKLDPLKLPDFFDVKGRFKVPEHLEHNFYVFCTNGAYCESLGHIELDNGYGLGKQFCLGVEDELLSLQGKLFFDRSSLADGRQNVLFDPEFEKSETIN